MPPAHKRNPFLVGCVNGKVIVVDFDLHAFGPQTTRDDLFPEIAIEE